MIVMQSRSYFNAHPGPMDVMTLYAARVPCDTCANYSLLVTYTNRFTMISQQKRYHLDRVPAKQ